MSSNNQVSFNHQVYQKAYKRLNLNKRERVIFQRLLGFLLRNDRPFPYTVPKLAELTGWGESSIFESLNILEKRRLIVRTGMGKNRKFSRGTILKLICTTVQNRTKTNQSNISTTVQTTDSKMSNSPESGDKKTSSSLKHKEKPSFPYAVDNFSKIKRDNYSRINGMKHLSVILDSLRNGNNVEKAKPMKFDL